MRALFASLLILLLCAEGAQAGIFDSLFGRATKKSDVEVRQSPEIVEEEEVAPDLDAYAEKKPPKVIVEEETISADEYMDSSEESDERIFDEQPALPDEQAVASDDESEISAEPTPPAERDPFIKVRNILLSYVEKPEKIYVGQHFRITVKAIIPQSDVTAIETNFIGGKSYKVFDRDRPWHRTGDNSYENSYTLKLTGTDAKLPNIKVRNQQKSGAVESEILKPFRAKVVALHRDDLFCNVVGDNLQVAHHKERPYDEHANIVVMEINATNANLEDFHIPYALREGIDELHEANATQRIYYYAVVSNAKKEFRFKYFNPASKRYEIVSFAIKPIDTTISTHTELNPRKNKYVLYKVIFLVSMALLFVMLFLYYRRYLFLGLALLFIVLLAYVQIPITKAKLPAGSALRILPIANSTVFFRTDTPLEVDILLKKPHYTKVLLPNKKIGWVRNEDIR